MRLALAALAALGLLSTGCTESTEKVVLRSLVASGALTAVCRNPDGTGTVLSDCPDRDTGETTLLSLVTQTMTDEVAVVRVASGAFPILEEGEVVDLDPSSPGYSFARLPGRPGEIVTTPGGAASFVGVTSVGHEGIVALPTTCLGPPRDPEAESRRDLTTFPACALPTAPGDIAVLVDPAAEDGSVPLSCDRSLGAQEGTPAGATRSECAADLTVEPGPTGRRKLAVALPAFGQIAIIDAQGVVDREPGTYGPCEVEAWVPLRVALPPSAVEQVLPPDLQATEGCELSTPAQPPLPPSIAPVPVGFALSDDRRLFVADRAGPVIHVLDAQNPCAMTELPSLLTASVELPDRAVTTSKLAVSPLTPGGRRFLYAIDEFDQPGASVMVFDVSPGASERTPLVRPGAPRLPLEPADRIGFASAAVDVGFALRDLPERDPVTGVATTGTLCDPDPSIDPNSAAAQYRPSSDYTSGARPQLLRGVFGFVLLSSGQVAIIDVEDFDAPCRRPLTVNESFRGCADDVGLPDFLTLDGTAESLPTVTTEVSCNVVETHRARAATLALNNSLVGVRAPSLRAFPSFSSPDPSVQSTLSTRPKLLAVDFAPSEPALVYVGSDLFGPPPNSNVLDKDPLTAPQNSVTLPLVEPRAYAAEEAFSLAYEGTITGQLPSGFFEATAGRLDDGTANFCDRGVYSVELMRHYGAETFDLEGDELDAFARQHADYVQITGDFPDDDDSYWSSPRAEVCGGRTGCETVFGDFDARQLSPLRDLRILDAEQNKLSLEPREYQNEQQKAYVEELIDCCFPTGVSYTVRASQQWVLSGSISGFRHDVVARETDDGVFRCERDCNPRKRYFRSRVFELSRRAGTECGASEEECTVGLADEALSCGAATAVACRDYVCTYDPSDGPIGPGQPGQECILDGLTARFAVYRGLEPSQRGMVFNWSTTGGFFPLSMNLTAQSANVLPQSMLYIPSLQHLAVVDYSSLGLALLSLDSLRVEAAFF